MYQPFTSPYFTFHLLRTLTTDVWNLTDLSKTGNFSLFTGIIFRTMEAKLASGTTTKVPVSSSLFLFISWLFFCLYQPHSLSLSLFFFNKFIYLFIFGALGLRCCAWAFSSRSERGLLFVAVRGLLIAGFSCCRAWALGTLASVVVARGLSSCGSRALEHSLSSCGARA